MHAIEFPWPGRGDHRLASKRTATSRRRGREVGICAACFQLRPTGQRNLQLAKLSLHGRLIFAGDLCTVGPERQSRLRVDPQAPVSALAHGIPRQTGVNRPEIPVWFGVGRGFQDAGGPLIWEIRDSFGGRNRRR